MINVIRARINILICCLMTGCHYEPPFNNFKDYSRVYVTTPPATLMGTAVAAGATAGTISWPILLGTGAGALVGAGFAMYKDSKPIIIKALQKRQIQVVQNRDTVTIIVPTDRYFLFNTPQLNQICFSGLALLIKLIKMFPPCCSIYVGGFTNDVGSKYHKNKLTQAQAEAMVAFLWANNIPAQCLNAEGYGDKQPVSDNKLIHGSAQNRRIEIQVLYSCASTAKAQIAPSEFK